MQRSARGFTLIELIMVIVILGVIGSMVAVFMRGPIDAYFASTRRAGLTDVADTTVRRMGRDLRTALPNSVRAPNAQCVEFIPTKTGGRYRTTGAGALDFAAAAGDAEFNELGSNLARPVDQRIAVGDWVVVYNLGIPGADAYAAANLNRSDVIGLGAEVQTGANAQDIETPIQITARQFPLASGGNRFHMVPAGAQVVSFVCDTTAGVQRLFRTTSSFANAAAVRCTTSGALPAGSTREVLATNVNACNFAFNNGADLRDALVRMTLQLTDTGETVSLQHEVHINNTP